MIHPYSLLFAMPLFALCCFRGAARETIRMMGGAA